MRVATPLSSPERTALFRRCGHPRIQYAQGECRAHAGYADPSNRRLCQARHRGGRWHLHGRRAGTGAGMPLPGRRLQGDDCHARGEAGLLPGAGGTQRLPRAVGVEKRTQHDRHRATVAAGDACRTRAVRRRRRRRPARGCARIRARRRRGGRARSVCAMCAIDYPNAEALFQFARNAIAAVSKHFPAPRKCIDAVAAAVAMPFDDGLRIERRLFLELMQTPESRALRHAFFAERARRASPALRRTRRVRNDRTRGASSAPARWAAASR